MESDCIIEDVAMGGIDGSHDPSDKLNVCRLSRKVNEKLRRDRLNHLIAQLAEEVPTIKYAHRRLDKSSVLRLTVSFLKLHQGLKRKNINRNSAFKDSSLYNKVNMMNDGVMMVLTQSGLILYVSPAVREIMGYHQSDVIGFDISRFIHPDDVACFSLHCEDGKEAAFATFEKNSEIEQPHHVCTQRGQKHTFYARMRKFVRSVKKKSEEEEEEVADLYELMHVHMHRETRADEGQGEESWLVVNIKPFVRESIKELSFNISEFQKNNEWASMHGLDGKFLAIEQRASLFTGFMASEVLGKTPYFLISDDDLMYVCRSHQLIILDEEIPSTVYRMKTLTGSPLYVNSRSIIIKDQWTKQPRCIVSVNEVLSNDLGPRMLDNQKQRVIDLTNASKQSAEKTDKSEMNALQEHDDTVISDIDTSNRSGCSAMMQIMTKQAEALKIHKCTGKSLGEIYEEEAWRYIRTVQNSDHSASPSSTTSSHPVKRTFDSLDRDDWCPQESSSSTDSCSGSFSQSSSYISSQQPTFLSENLQGNEINRDQNSYSSSRPILKSILEGKLNFTEQNEYSSAIQDNSVTDKVHSVTDKVHSVSDKAHSVSDKAHCATYKAHNALDKAYTSIDMAHSVTDKAHMATNKAHSALDKACSALNKTQSVTDKAQCITYKAHNAMDKAHMVTDKAHGALDKAYKAHSVTDKAHSAADKAYSSLDKAYSAINKAHSVTDKAQHITDKAQMATDKAHGALDKEYKAHSVTDKAPHITDKAYSSLDKAYSAINKAHSVTDKAQHITDKALSTSNKEMFSIDEEYSALDRDREYDSAVSLDSWESLAGYNGSTSLEYDGSLPDMSPDSEVSGPVQSPTIGSNSLLEDMPLDQSLVHAHFTKQLLSKYSQIKDTFSSHRLTVEALQRHLENKEAITVMNPEQHEIYRRLIGRLRHTENQLNSKDHLLDELEGELLSQNNKICTY